MKTDAKVVIYCATCPARIGLYYSHESLASRTLADDIKHDATISSDWHFRDGLFYCDSCGDGLENTRDEQAKSPQQQNTEAWRRGSYADITRKRLAAYEDSIPYASAIRENLFIKER